MKKDYCNYTDKPIKMPVGHWPNLFLPEGYDPRREFMFKEKDIDLAMKTHSMLIKRFKK